MWVIFLNKINTTFRYFLIFSSGTSLFFFFILANSLSYFFNFRAYGDRRRFLITWCNEMRFKLLGTWWMAVCRIRFNLFGIGNFSSSMTFPYTLRILIPMSFKYSKEEIIRTLTNSHRLWTGKSLWIVTVITKYLKGACHGICYLLEIWECFDEIVSAVCCYGWQRWTGIEKVEFKCHACQNHQKIWFVLPDEICLKSLSYLYIICVWFKAPRNYFGTESAQSRDRVP